MGGPCDVDAAVDQAEGRTLVFPHSIELNDRFVGAVVRVGHTAFAAAIHVDGCVVFVQITRIADQVWRDAIRAVREANGVQALNVVVVRADNLLGFDDNINGIRDRIDNGRAGNADLRAYVRRARVAVGYRSNQRCAERVVVRIR